MHDIILPLLLFRLRRPERAAVLERLLPTALPMPSGQRLTVATLLADQQVKRQARVEEAMVEEAVKAAKFTAPDQLAGSPTLQAKFLALPQASQDRIFPPRASTADVKPAKGGIDR